MTLHKAHSPTARFVLKFHPTMRSPWKEKLVGSAQARRKEGVLQHGSLPIFGDLTRITQVLAYSNEAIRAQAAARLLAHAANAEGLGKSFTWEEAANALSLAFSETLNLEFLAKSLTAAEIDRAEELVSKSMGILPGP